jgi:hypothetical protein
LERSGWKSKSSTTTTTTTTTTATPVPSSTSNGKKKKEKQQHASSKKEEKGSELIRIGMRNELVKRVRNFLSPNLVPPPSRLLHLLNQVC